MLVRIVKMSFEPKHITQFLNTFNTQKEQIRNFSGCHFLELYQDKSSPNIYFTYSYWDDEMALNLYRDSDLFNEIWGKTKILFNDTPQAWSVNKIASLP